MTEVVMLLTDQTAGQVRPALTAAQKSLREGKALLPETLLHGAYYGGMLDDSTTIGRWHAHKRCFVFWEHNMGQLKLKAAPHVAQAGAAAGFAPLSRQESEGEYHISDFAFETTH